MRDLLSSWSVRIGLALLLVIFLIVPWRRVLLWDTGDSVVVPLKVIQYGWLWSRPFEATLDLTRLITEILLLSVVVVVAYRFEQSRSARQQ